jgi:hypothetical protein
MVPPQGRVLTRPEEPDVLVGRHPQKFEAFQTVLVGSNPEAGHLVLGVRGGLV